MDSINGILLTKQLYTIHLYCTMAKKEKLLNILNFISLDMYGY